MVVATERVPRRAARQLGAIVIATAMTTAATSAIIECTAARRADADSAALAGTPRTPAARSARRDARTPTAIEQPITSDPEHHGSRHQRPILGELATTRRTQSRTDPALITISPHAIARDGQQDDRPWAPPPRGCDARQHPSRART
jgi:hypothetical protein